MTETVTNALSVDVEEYYHAFVFRDGTAGLPVRSWPSRVEESVERVLELLGDHGIEATFFTLGEVAAAHPAMVRKIAGEGHEIACHDYRHERVCERTPGQFRADVRRAKALLEDLADQVVLGYRAPNFSIGPGESWAYELLLEEGFRYDSSTYPIWHDRYGDFRAARFPGPIGPSGETRLLEFPVGTVRIGGTNLPIGGGGYFRLLPAELVVRGIQRVNAREGRPVMFYFHPWELDAGQPRPPMAWRKRTRHYVGLAREREKLGRLFRAVHFGSARQVLGLTGR